MKFKLLVLTLASTPFVLFAHGKDMDKKAGTETWKINGLNDTNRGRIQSLLEDVDDVKNVSFSDTMDTVTLVSKMGRSIDDDDVKDALNKVEGITANKQVSRR